MPDYVDQACLLLGQYTRKEARSASGRPAYASIAKLIQQLIRIGGEEAARAIYDELWNSRPVRPALRDEIRVVRFN